MKAKILVRALLCAFAIPAQAAEPAHKAMPTSTIEALHIAPGQHEAFPKMLAHAGLTAARLGPQPDQRYVHGSGASWDFALIKPHDQDSRKWEELLGILHSEGYPSGPDYSFESRKMFRMHEDTEALGHHRNRLSIHPQHNPAVSASPA